MSLKAKVDVSDALRGLKKLDGKAKKAIKKGVIESSKVATKELKQVVPVDTGLLKKAIGRKVKTYRAAARVLAIIGARTGFGTGEGKRRRDPAKYHHLVEYGTKRNPPNAKMRQLWDSNKERYYKIMFETIRKMINVR